MQSQALVHAEPFATPAAAAISVQPVDPLKIADWDTQTSGLDRFSFFHKAAWAAVLQRTYGFHPLYLRAHRGTALAGVLPLMEVRSPITGRRGVSLPFTDQCDLLGDSESTARSLVDAAMSLGRSRGWKYLECRGGASLAAAFHGATPSLSFFGHVLALTPNTDALFGKLESSVRRAIRKAEKSGLTIEIARSESAVREYYRLHCMTRKQHGLPPQPISFFLNIHREILSQNLGMVVSAKFKEKPVAAAIYFHTDAHAIYKFGASDSSFQELRANNLVMWEAIKRCAAEGKKSLDFGRTSIANEGLRRYKLGWGTAEHRVEYFKFDFRKNEFVTDADETSGWHTRVFSAMPIPLARCAGAMLYRHVA